MAEFRPSPEAEHELDDIWPHIARDRGSVETANRVIDRITESVWLLAQHPHIGRRRDHWRPGLRSFPVNQYVTVHRVEGDVILILHIFHGKRDIDSLLEP